MSCLKNGKSHRHNISGPSVLGYNHYDDCWKKQTKQIRNKGTKTIRERILGLACFQFCHYPFFLPPKDRSMPPPPPISEQTKLHGSNSFNTRRYRCLQVNSSSLNSKWTRTVLYSALATYVFPRAFFVNLHPTIIFIADRNKFLLSYPAAEMSNAKLQIRLLLAWLIRNTLIIIFLCISFNIRQTNRQKYVYFRERQFSNSEYILQRYKCFRSVLLTVALMWQKWKLLKEKAQSMSNQPLRILMFR